MGTRATIRFKDRDDEVFIYRGHDGFPEDVVKEIQEVIDAKEISWSGAECFLLATCFVGWFFNKDERLPDYEITSSFHGDESYKYYVDYNTDLKKWEVSYV